MNRNTSFQNLLKMLISPFIFVYLFFIFYLSDTNSSLFTLPLSSWSAASDWKWFLFRLLRSSPVAEDTHLIKWWRRIRSAGAARPCGARWNSVGDKAHPATLFQKHIVIHVPSEEGRARGRVSGRVEIKDFPLKPDTWNLWLTPNCVTNPAPNLLLQVCAPSLSGGGLP